MHLKLYECFHRPSYPYLLVFLHSLSYHLRAFSNLSRMQFTHDLLRSGLTVFVLSSIAFAALASAVITFVIIEAFLGTDLSITLYQLCLTAYRTVACLVFVLWSLFVVASFTTAVVFFVYWTMRLGMFITREGPSGVTDWAHETRQYVFCSVKREPSDETDESTVIVDRDGPISKKVKVEEEEASNN